MKTMFVIAGRAPSWVLDQTRYAAKQLTEDGRVLVALTSPSDGGVHLPGQPGGSTLLAIASSGYPVWTGRTSSALGFRRGKDQVVVVLFDSSQATVTVVSALMARLRGERVLIHDLTNGNVPRSRWQRAWQRVLRSLAHERLTCATPGVNGDRGVVLAICDNDRKFAELVVGAARSMASVAAADWRVVVQSTDPEIDRLVVESNRDDMLSCESGPVPDDLFHLSDVVIVRHGKDDHYADAALQNGASAIIVGHPVSGRLARRFDGAWLTREDAASILVAIESALGSTSGGGRSAPELRADGDELVRLIRQHGLAEV